MLQTMEQMLQLTIDIKLNHGQIYLGNCLSCYSLGKFYRFIFHCMLQSNFSSPSKTVYVTQRIKEFKTFAELQQFDHLFRNCNGVEIKLRAQLYLHWKLLRAYSSRKVSHSRFPFNIVCQNRSYEQFKHRCVLGQRFSLTFSVLSFSVQEKLKLYLSVL